MESKKTLLAALFKAQGNITMPKKDGTNPHFKSRYATLSAVLEAITAPCQNAGLLVVQSVGCDDNGDELTTTIYHAESGEQITTTCRLPLDKPTAQGVGSAITYMRRYSLMALFMLNAEDDDGNTASQARDPHWAAKPAPAKPKPRPMPSESKDVLHELLADLAVLSKTGNAKAILAWLKSVGHTVKERLNDRDRALLKEAYGLAITGADEAVENDDPPQVTNEQEKQ